MPKHHRQPSIRFFYTYFLIHYYRDLLPTLIDQGWKVEVVISRAEYRRGMSLQFHSGVSVRYIPTLGFRSNSKLGKAMVTLTYTIFGLLFTIFGPTVNSNIFFTQPPLFSSLWGYLLKRIRKQTNYQILQDIFPDIAIETGHIQQNSLLARSLMTFSRFTLRRADHIGVIGRCMEKKLIQEGFPPEKITLLPNWSNADLVESLPHEKNPFRTEHDWQDRFVIVFAGNIGIPQYFDDILTVCSRLQNRRPEFLLAFIGSGSRIKDIQYYKEQHSLNNIVFIPFQNIETQSAFLSAGDVHFVSLKAGIEGLAVPSKSYSIMAAGRPIIYQGSPEGEMAKLVVECGIGTSVPLNNPDILEQAILDYMNNSNLREMHGKNARNLAETDCSYHAATQHITKLLHDHNSYQ